MPLKEGGAAATALRVMDTFCDNQDIVRNLIWETQTPAVIQEIISEAVKLAESQEKSRLLRACLGTLEKADDRATIVGTLRSFTGADRTSLSGIGLSKICVKTLKSGEVNETSLEGVRLLTEIMKTPEGLEEVKLLGGVEAKNHFLLTNKSDPAVQGVMKSLSATDEELQETARALQDLTEAVASGESLSADQLGAAKALIGDIYLHSQSVDGAASLLKQQENVVKSLVELLVALLRSAPIDEEAVGSAVEAVRNLYKQEKITGAGVFDADTVNLLVSSVAGALDVSLQRLQRR